MPALMLLLIQAAPMPMVQRVSPPAPRNYPDVVKPVAPSPILPEMAAAECKLKDDQARNGRNRPLAKLRDAVKVREQKGEDSSAPRTTITSGRLRYYSNLYWEAAAAPGRPVATSLLAKDLPSLLEVVILLDGSAYRFPVAYRPLGRQCVIHPGGLQFCNSMSENRAFVDRALLDRLAAAPGDTRLLLKTDRAGPYYCNYATADDVKAFLERL